MRLKDLQELGPLVDGLDQALLSRQLAAMASATAWAAYSKAWPEAMRGPRSRGQRLLDAGFKPRPRLTGAGGLMREDE